MVNKLPVDEILVSLQQELTANPVVVLEAPPGAGKTTRVPLALLDLDWLKDKKILMLEPRRIATRNAAEFMARQLNEPVGQTIGYRIRYDNKISSATRIEVMTEGILTRRLHSDPELADVGLVIFDEFHERNIHSDLALALTNDLRKGLREDLRILIMSATLDSAPLAELLGATRIRSEGRAWPVEVRYLGREIASDCTPQMISALKTATQDTSGDILAFLPGAREINQVIKGLGRVLSPVKILPLHGSLPQKEQQEVFRQTQERKVILATNIAETSLTIDGVTTVIDSGLCRQPGYDAGRGRSRLRTTRISQASSLQRAGRAGRQGPGICYRLWSEAFQKTLLPHNTPEILCTDLAPLALNLAAWGIRDSSQLDWLDRPAPGALLAANNLLHQLELTDARGLVTPLGEKAGTLPVHPRFARLLLGVSDRRQLSLACLLVALLSEGRPTQSGDLCDQLEQLIRDLGHERKGFSPVERAFRQLSKRFNCDLPTLQQADPEVIANLLTLAFPDHIGRSRNKNTDVLLANGSGAQLPAHSSVVGAEWLVAAEIHQTDSGQARLTNALPLGSTWLKEKTRSAAWQNETCWDHDAQRIRGLRVKRLGSLVLCSEPCAPDAQQTTEILSNLLAQSGEALLNWNKDCLQLLARASLVHEQYGPPWPNLSVNHLLAHIEDWLTPYLQDTRSAAQLKRIDLLPALQGLFTWEQRTRLDQLAPHRVLVPSGEKMKIDYREETPTLRVKLQMLFGQAETPSICEGRVRLQIQLLSPAGRPLAITSDLASFWDQVYPEVKKEMKGRYPKHPWPEDPWQATPTRRTNNRKR